MGATAGAIAGTACPKGYYCQAGTGLYTQTPCPIGTFRATTSATQASDCTACTAKFYCPEPGLIAGNAFKCGAGYLCAAGSESVRGNELCPVDHWCKDGTKTKCAAATYSTVGGIEAATECVECPPGKICGNNSVGIVDCPAGKYCPGKHSLVS